MGANVEKKKNILGETSVTIAEYEKQGTVEPYYCDKDDALFTRLQNIVDNSETLDDLKSDIVDVHLWDAVSGQANVYNAIKWPGQIEVTSYGGNALGYAIPFNFHYTEAGIKGTFNINTKVFTPNGASV